MPYARRASWSVVRLVGLVCLISPARADDLWSDPAFTLYQQAIEAYNARRYELAAKRLDGALARYPANVLALELAGDVAGLRSRHNEAAAFYDRLIKLFPDYAGAWRKRAEALERAKAFKRAEAAYALALERWPDDERLLMGGARVALRLERPEAARRLLKRCLKLKPNDQAAFLRVVDLYTEAGQLSEILDEFEKRAAKTRHPDLLQRLGMHYFTTGKNDKAILWLQRAIEAGRATASVYYALGTAQYRRGFLPEAEHSLVRAIEADPRLADAWYNLGVTYLTERKTKKALVAFKSAAHIRKTDAGIFDRIADIYEYHLLDMANAKTYRDKATAARRAAAATRPR